MIEKRFQKVYNLIVLLRRYKMRKYKLLFMSLLLVFTLAISFNVNALKNKTAKVFYGLRCAFAPRRRRGNKKRKHHCQRAYSRAWREDCGPGTRDPFVQRHQGLPYPQHRPIVLERTLS